MRRYEKNEKLEDFFQALMETKDGIPQMLPLGEINAECSIMRNRPISSPLKMTS